MDSTKIYVKFLSSEYFFSSYISPLNFTQYIRCALQNSDPWFSNKNYSTLYQAEGAFTSNLLPTIKAARR